MTSHPPRRAERLASWSLAAWERSAVLGDLAEEFHEIESTNGARAARRWYWRQTIISIWPNVLRRLRGDERRRSELGDSVQTLIAAGFMVFVPDSAAAHGPLGAIAAVAWPLLLFNSAIRAGLALFSERVQMLRSQLRTRRLLATGGLALLLFILTQGSAGSHWVVAAVFLTVGLDSLRLWPWWRPDPAPAELAIGVKRDPPALGPAEVVTSVPNVRLGLSDLVLCRPRTTGAARATWQDEATIHRTFAQSQSFRVCAVVNLGDKPASATIDLVDASGRIARHRDAPVVVGALATVPRTWDDLVDGDPAEHFGRIDATIDLHGLAGPYDVRLTVSDAEHTSVKAESIVITAARPHATLDHPKS